MLMLADWHEDPSLSSEDAIFRAEMGLVLTVEKANKACNLYLSSTKGLT